MPLLRAAAASGSDVRVINVGSNAVADILGQTYPVDFSDRSIYRGVFKPKPLPMRSLHSLVFEGDGMRYAISKLAFMMFSAELQRRFDAEKLPILSVAINPGPADSHGLAPSMLKPMLRPLVKWMTVTPEKASWNALFFATAEEGRSEKYRGKYHEPVAVVTPAHVYLEDVKQREVLWDATTDEIDKYLKGKGRQPLGPW